MDSSKATAQTPLSDEALLKANLDAWKTIVDVQQHFNDLGWRIRSLAITALTFTLGATFFGFLNAKPVAIADFAFNPAAGVPVLGALIWILFWFADGLWYHRLLTGAGKAAAPLESFLLDHGISSALSGSITEASHEPWLKNRFTGKLPLAQILLNRRTNSTRKLNFFYVCGLAVLLIPFAAVLAFTGHTAVGAKSPAPAPSVAVSVFVSTS